MPKKKIETKGMLYAPGVPGKHLYRIRERHVADHLGELIRRKATGAARLDLLLRGIALLPQHASQRPHGLVLPRVSYAKLHDLCRESTQHCPMVPEDNDHDPEFVDFKRRWVAEQLATLEDLNLVRREERPGGRPRLFVLRDDGSGNPLDDPDGSTGNTYITVAGSVIASDWFKLWGGPELAAYLCSLAAERYARARTKNHDPAVPVEWYRPLTWFADREGVRRPREHVRFPFATSTLERGFRALAEGGLVTRRRTMTNPEGGRFVHPRTIYTNRYNERIGHAKTEPLLALIKSSG